MLLKKAVLIIHGFAGGTYDEEYLANYLELKGFDVYTFTLPGHDRMLFNKITKEDRPAAASYMAFIMQEYRRLIPADKQYGISISGITETNTGYKLCPWTSDYNRNEMYEGIVDGLK